MVFDVSTAFLSGMTMTREVYAQAPREGMPTAEGWGAVSPHALLRLLRVAYGLTEAPRLWYLRARQVPTKLGFEEFRCARATFVYRDSGAVIAMLTLHVDDGMLFGDIEDQRSSRIRTQINNDFTIKPWKTITDKTPMEYLDTQWIRENKMLCIHSSR